MITAATTRGVRGAPSVPDVGCARRARCGAMRRACRAPGPRSASPRARLGTTRGGAAWGGLGDRSWCGAGRGGRGGSCDVPVVTCGTCPGARAGPVDSFLRPVRAGRHRASPPRWSPVVLCEGRGAVEGRRRQRSGFVPASTWAWRQGCRPSREAPTTGRADLPRRVREHARAPRGARRKDVPWPS
jgi:hypothetical protein